MQIIVPESEQHWLQLRTQDLTSTDIAALFGMSPYATKFEVWHRKASGEVPEFRENDRMKWGNRLEGPIAAGIADDNSWKIRNMRRYIRHEDARIGSSFDFEVVSNDKGPGILEIKNVDYFAFKEGWLIDDDKNIEAPPHIELQLQHQLEIANRNWGAIGALIGGNDVKLLIRDRDREIGQAIREEAEKFWMSIAAGTPPPPEYPQDAGMICRLYGYADPGKMLETDDAEIVALVASYASAAAKEKEAKEMKESCKAQIFEKIDSVERLIVPGFSVSAGMVAPTYIEAYERKGYRNFRVTAKKVKS